jgi:pentatricopeptide repeat protein
MNPTSPEFSDLLKRLSKDRKSSDILEVLTGIKRAGGLVPSTGYRILLDSCLATKNSTVACEALSLIRGEPGSRELIVRVLEVCSAAGDADACKDVIRLMKEAGLTVTPDSYSKLLDAYAVSGDTQAVITLGEELKSKGFKTDVHNVVLKSCLSRGDFATAKTFFDDLLKQNVRLDQYSYGTFIKCAVNAGREDEALDLVRRTAASRPRSLSSYSFNNLMQGYALKGNAAMVFQIFNEMKAIAERGPKYSLIQPDVYSYGIALRTASEANDKAAVSELLLAMLGDPRMELSHATWRTATAPFGRDQDCSGLRKLIGKSSFLLPSCKPMYVQYIYIYSIYIYIERERMRSFVCMHRSPLIFQFFVIALLSIDGIHHVGYQTSLPMWRDLVGCFGKRGLSEDALRVVAEMKEKFGVAPDGSCWMRVIRSFTSSRLPPPRQGRGGYESFATSANKTTTPEGSAADSLNSSESRSEAVPSPQREALRSLGGFNWEGGHRALRLMRMDGVRPSADIWHMVIEACAKTPVETEPGGAALSSLLLDLLVEMFEADNAFPRPDTWNIIVHSLVGIFPSSQDGATSRGDAQLLKPSLNFALDMMTLDIELLNKFFGKCPPQLQEMFLYEMASTLCRLERESTAYSILCDVRPFQPTHIKAWFLLMETYSRSGDTEVCLQLLNAFEAVSGSPAPAPMWSKLIESIAAAGDYSKAYQTADNFLSRYSSSGRSIRSASTAGSKLRLDILDAEFFNSMIRIGITQKNRAVIERYLNELKTRGIPADLNTWSTLSAYYISTGDSNLAMDCAKKMISLIIESPNPAPPGLTPAPLIAAATAPSGLRALAAHTASSHSSSSSEIAAAAAALATATAPLPAAPAAAAAQSSSEIEGKVAKHFSPVLDVMIQQEYWGLPAKVIDRIHSVLNVDAEVLCRKYIAALTAAGHVEDSVKFAEKCIKRGMMSLKEASLWHSMLLRCRELKRPDDAQFVIQQMMYSLNIPPDLGAWSVLVGALGDAGRIAEAIETMKVS